MLKEHYEYGTDTGAVMVCGGGIAGIQSALDLANSGFKVYLVEKSPTIGGKMAQLDKTFPTGDCATCIISPKLVECTRNLNIEILTQSEIEEMTGEPGDFHVKLQPQGPIHRHIQVQLLRRLREGLPGARSRRVQPRPRHHDRHTQGNRPGRAERYVIDKRERPPCVSACPMGQNAQAYVALIGAGKFAEAAEIIRQGQSPAPDLRLRLPQTVREPSASRADTARRCRSGR